MNRFAKRDKWFLYAKKLNKKYYFVHYNWTKNKLYIHLIIILLSFSYALLDIELVELALWKKQFMAKRINRKVAGI